MFLIIGYLATILIETPILVLGLSGSHPISRRIFAGIWLTACTYPMVNLVLPILLRPFGNLAYVAISEIFAPVAECAIFSLAFHESTIARSDRARDFLVIVVANVLSFVLGMWLFY